MGHHHGKTGESEMTDRIAVYGGTRNLYHEMMVAAKSLLYHNGADHVYFLMEDDVFPEKVPSCITCVPAHEQPWFPSGGPNYNSKWTYMILLRAAYSKIFRRFDRVLSLDVDTIVRGNIDWLWNVDLTGKYYAGVREIIKGHDDEEAHYNFGVVMMNLDMLRDGTDDRIISMLNNEKLTCPEQDAFNRICEGKILEIPPEYNATWYNEAHISESHAKIRHYANDRPMKDHMEYRRFDRMDWEKVLRTCGTGLR